MINVNNMSLAEVMKTLNEKYGAGLILPHEDKFTPERLLGVETNHGHVRAINNNLVICEGSGAWFVDELEYYISDDSDETVSFEEYVKLFYNTEDTL